MGDDVLVGGAAADSLGGGAGLDTADSVCRSLARGRVDLDRTGEGGDAEGDACAGVENLRGSRFGDTLRGTDGFFVGLGTPSARIVGANNVMTRIFRASPSRTRSTAATASTR
ncbi:hypothetical protein AB5I41_09015 [Sphingomonas sp. MMS24-JH45]